MSPALPTSPFHAQVAAACHSYDWRRWSGYPVPSKYEFTHEREYHAIRNAAALIDVSPLYKYWVQGRDAMRLLNRIMVRDVSACRVGQVQYTVWCDEHGHVIEDGTLARLAPDTYRVTAAEPNLRWFQDNALGLDVSVTDVSAALGALALQGPRSREILERVVAGADVAALRYFRIMPATIAGRSVEISRTGYTGDLGYELWVRPDDAPTVWQELLAAGVDYGLAPAGMLALDMARIEAGLILVDVDYTPANKALIPAEKSTPYELNLGWAVKLDKPGYFVGREALAAASVAPAWRLCGLLIDWPSLERAYNRVGLPVQAPHTAWRRSVPLYRGRREAGYATSGSFSPLLKQYIALATLRAPYAEPGTELEMEITVEHMRRRTRARVVDLPFFDPPRKKR